MIPDWAKEMNCAVTVCDKDGVIIYMNDKAKETVSSLVIMRIQEPSLQNSLKQVGQTAIPSRRMVSRK